MIPKSIRLKITKVYLLFVPHVLGLTMALFHVDFPLGSRLE